MILSGKNPKIFPNKSGISTQTKYLQENLKRNYFKKYESEVFKRWLL